MSLYERLLSLLPLSVGAAIREAEGAVPDLPGRLMEVRLRAGRYAALTLPEGNRLLPVTVGAEELAALVTSLCRGSVYAYREELCEGYLDAGDGIRVGVAGRCVSGGGGTLAVTDVSSLVFRLPHTVPTAGEEAERLFRARGGCGMLVFSPPAVGKTTLLRDLARRLSEGAPPYRVALIDCRGELSLGPYGRRAMVDILRSYPKAEGITQAVRTLAPEVVMVDEVGTRGEAEAILGAATAGVPLVATVHARTLWEALTRSAVVPLLRAEVFSVILGLFRTEGGVAVQTYLPPFGERGGVAAWEGTQ